MTEYTLYLDEILPLESLKYFCLAGVIIRDDIYTTDIVTSVNAIKDTIFESRDVILHEASIKRPKNNTPYMKVKDIKTRERYFSLVKELFDTKDFYVIGAALNADNAQQLYPGHRDRYFMCLQIILENFTHFLIANNAVGKIVIESRNPKQNGQLRKHFNNLRCSTGTLFYNPKEIGKYISSIEFPEKKSNNIGLQIADMIPNPINRELSGMKQVVPGLIGSINRKIYDGNLDKVNRFGMKILVKQGL